METANQQENITIDLKKRNRKKSKKKIGKKKNKKITANITTVRVKFAFPTEVYNSKAKQFQFQFEFHFQTILSVSYALKYSFFCYSVYQSACFDWPASVVLAIAVARIFLNLILHSQLLLNFLQIIRVPLSTLFVCCCCCFFFHYYLLFDFILIQ